ncbi:MAG: hypothetical protein PHT25_05975 [Bacteroidales bacterium]|nr:hypothetical protein [Bacteroidales bacterium]
MKKVSILLTIFFAAVAVTANAQTINPKVIDNFNPSTVRGVYEIIRHVPLNEAKQVELARAIEQEDSLFADLLRKEQVLGTISQKKLSDLHKKNMLSILSEEEMDQYYRGISDTEAEALAVTARETINPQINGGYQDGKFIYASFYKIYLESKVAELKYSDDPARLKAALKKIREDEFKVLLDKSGIVATDELKGSRAWTFKPNTPVR